MLIALQPRELTGQPVEPAGQRRLLEIGVIGRQEAFDRSLHDGGARDPLAIRQVVNATDQFDGQRNIQAATHPRPSQRDAVVMIERRLARHLPHLTPQHLALPGHVFRLVVQHHLELLRGGRIALVNDLDMLGQIGLAPQPGVGLVFIARARLLLRLGLGHRQGQLGPAIWLCHPRDRGCFGRRQ